MSGPRTALHLLAPPPPDHLRDRFPAFEVQAGKEVFRCHSATRGPLWFTNGGHGRFDLADPDGTCYTAESEQITLLETWGGLRVVPSTELTARAVTRLEIVDSRSLADLTSNTAAQFGVTAEIFSTGNYRLTQLWASALRSAGFSGIRYWARHDLAHTYACMAMFGTSGAHSSTTEGPGNYEVTETDKLSERPDLSTHYNATPASPFFPFHHLSEAARTDEHAVSCSHAVPLFERYTSVGWGHSNSGRPRSARMLRKRQVPLQLRGAGLLASGVGEAFEQTGALVHLDQQRHDRRERQHLGQLRLERQRLGRDVLRRQRRDHQLALLVETDQAIARGQALFELAQRFA